MKQISIHLSDNLDYLTANIENYNQKIPILKQRNPVLLTGEINRFLSRNDLNSKNITFNCHWKNSHIRWTESNVWPPTIDSYFLAYNAVAYMANKTNIFKSVIDIGCGTGVVGLSVAKTSGIKNVTGIDSNNLSKSFFLDNLQINQVKGTFIKKLSNGYISPLSIIVSNPPYWDNLDIINKNSLDSGLTAKATIQGALGAKNLYNDLFQLLSISERGPIFFNTSSINQSSILSRLRKKSILLNKIKVPLNAFKRNISLPEKSHFVEIWLSIPKT